MSLTGNCLSLILHAGCRLWMTAVFVILLGTTVSAQVIPDSDSLFNVPADTSPLSATDSTLRQGDSSAISIKEAELGIKIAKDALPSRVVTSAKDSAVLNVKGNKYYLYGDSKANYEELEIKSGQLIFDQKTSTLSALPILDTAGKKISTQEFKQGQEVIAYDTLRYNFQSKKALVRNARSQYGDGFMISEQVKRNADGSISGLRNVYTTCNLDHPHFGIKARKVKVVPGRVIASGPANLEIQDVPTPLWLPFGVFPEKKSQASGFLLPTYTLEENRGLGLQRGGYYFAVNDYLGVIAQFDIYSKGSWAAFTTSQYSKRYQYNGSLALNYAYTKIGEIYEPNGQIFKDFKVNWNHQVDPKARPGTNFSAAVSFGTSTFNQLNGIGVENILDNQYNSSITYSKSWKNKPYQLSVAARHNQSTQSGLVTVGLPDINFNLGQFSPFQRKQMIGLPRWYEKISASYSVQATNQLRFYDTAFSFNNLSLADFENGIRHSAQIQANYTLLRYFNWNISVPYTEYWNTRQLYTRYNNDLQREDTVLYRNGFFTSRQFEVSTSVSTRIYGLKTFKKGKIAGLRHVLTPNVSFGYTPGFAQPPFDYLYEYTDAYGMESYRSPYSGTPIGGPSNALFRGAVSFRLDNNLQMKVRTRDTSGDAGTKIISLIDGLSFNTSYDLFRDSNNLSNINLSFRTSLLKIFNISAAANFDPYRYDGRIRTKEYLLNTGGGLADFQNGNVTIGFSLQGEKSNQKEQDDAEKNNEQVQRLMQNGRINDYYDFNIPWNLSVNAGLSATRDRGRPSGDTILYRPNLTFNGGFNLTERWKVNVSSGFVFERIDKVTLGLTSIDISRDLHCWQMNLNLVPFGFRRSFNFTLQVKASVLQDLKLTRRKAYQDYF
jgi:hypothetical protein